MFVANHRIRINLCFVREPLQRVEGLVFRIGYDEVPRALSSVAESELDSAMELFEGLLVWY